MVNRKKNNDPLKGKGAGKNQIVPRTKGACSFCHSTEDNELVYGKKYTKKDLCIHYFCMLFASGLCQNGRTDHVGILGFLIPDIIRETKRSARLKCCYCKKVNATIGCVRPNCRVSFHFGCGVENGALNQFYGNFSSYCSEHRLMQPALSVGKRKTSSCLICMCSVECKPTASSLYVTCCKSKTWYHRICLQKMAISSGIHFFKCPLCSNKDDFQEEMMKYGVYIPDQDAAWELEPGAYQDLLVRHCQCDVDTCLCPGGRKLNAADTKWEIVLCDWCGSQGCHMKCGKLRSPNDDWVCGECRSVEFERAVGRKKTKTKAQKRKRKSEPAGIASAEESESAPLKKKRRYTKRSSTGRNESLPTPLPHPPRDTRASRRLSLRRTSRKGQSSTIERLPTEQTIQREPATQTINSEGNSTPSPVKMPSTNHPVLCQKLGNSLDPSEKGSKQMKITSYGELSPDAKAGEATPSSANLKSTPCSDTNAGKAIPSSANLKSTPRPYRKKRTLSQNNTLSKWLVNMQSSDSKPNTCRMDESQLILHLEETPPKMKPKRAYKRKRLSAPRRQSPKYLAKTSEENCYIGCNGVETKPLASDNSQNIVPVLNIAKQLISPLTTSQSPKKPSTSDNSDPNAALPDRPAWLRGIFDLNRLEHSECNRFSESGDKIYPSTSTRYPMRGVGMPTTCISSDHPRSDIYNDPDVKQENPSLDVTTIKKKRGRPFGAKSNKKRGKPPGSSKKIDRQKGMQEKIDKDRRAMISTVIPPENLKLLSPKKCIQNVKNGLKSKSPGKKRYKSFRGLMSYQEFFDFLISDGFECPSNPLERLALYQSYKDGDYKLHLASLQRNLSIENLRGADKDTVHFSLTSADVPVDLPSTPESEEPKASGPFGKIQSTNSCHNDFTSSISRNRVTKALPIFGSAAMFGNMYSSDSDSNSSTSYIVQKAVHYIDSLPTKKSSPSATVTSEAQMEALEKSKESVMPLKKIGSFEDLTDKVPLLDIPLPPPIVTIHKDIPGPDFCSDDTISLDMDEYKGYIGAVQRDFGEPEEAHEDDSVVKENDTTKESFKTIPTDDVPVPDVPVLNDSVSGIAPGALCDILPAEDRGKNVQRWLSQVDSTPCKKTVETQNCESDQEITRISQCDLESDYTNVHADGECPDSCPSNDKEHKSDFPCEKRAQEDLSCAAEIEKSVSGNTSKDTINNGVLLENNIYPAVSLMDEVVQQIVCSEIRSVKSASEGGPKFQSINKVETQSVSNLHKPITSEDGCETLTGACISSHDGVQVTELESVPVDRHLDNQGVCENASPDTQEDSPMMKTVQIQTSPELDDSCMYVGTTKPGNSDWPRTLSLDAKPDTSLLECGEHNIYREEKSLEEIDYIPAKEVSKMPSCNIGGKASHTDALLSNSVEEIEDNNLLSNSIEEIQASKSDSSIEVIILDDAKSGVPLNNTRAPNPVHCGSTPKDREDKTQHTIPSISLISSDESDNDRSPKKNVPLNHQSELIDLTETTLESTTISDNLKKVSASVTPKKPPLTCEKCAKCGLLKKNKKPLETPTKK